MKMAKTSTNRTESPRRGRPQMYTLTSKQVSMVNTRLNKGLSAAKIAQELGIHEYAVLRIRRGSAN